MNILSDAQKARMSPEIYLEKVSVEMKRIQRKRTAGMAATLDAARNAVEHRADSPAGSLIAIQRVPCRAYPD